MGSKNVQLLFNSYYASKNIAVTPTRNLLPSLFSLSLLSPSPLSSLSYSLFPPLTYISAFSGRSDYGPFLAAGIPAGGLFTGAEEVKSIAQRYYFILFYLSYHIISYQSYFLLYYIISRFIHYFLNIRQEFGGLAGAWLDPCYHQACDTIDVGFSTTLPSPPLLLIILIYLLFFSVLFLQNINVEVLGDMSRGAASVIEHLAVSHDLPSFLKYALPMAAGSTLQPLFVIFFGVLAVVLL